MASMRRFWIFPSRPEWPDSRSSGLQREASESAGSPISRMAGIAAPCEMFRRVLGMIFGLVTPDRCDLVQRFRETTPMAPVDLGRQMPEQISFCACAERARKRGQSEFPDHPLPVGSTCWEIHSDPFFSRAVGGA